MQKDFQQLLREYPILKANILHPSIDLKSPMELIVNTYSKTELNTINQYISKGAWTSVFLFYFIFLNYFIIIIILILFYF